MPTKIIKLPVGGIKITIKNGGGYLVSSLKSEDADDEIYNSAIDGMESLILAHALLGVDVQNRLYVKGIEQAVESIDANT